MCLQGHEENNSTRANLVRSCLNSCRSAAIDEWPRSANSRLRDGMLNGFVSPVAAFPFLSVRTRIGRPFRATL
jgi:hypothetical protein